MRGVIYHWLDSFYIPFGKSDWLQIGSVSEILFLLAPNST